MFSGLAARCGLGQSALRARRRKRLPGRARSPAKSQLVAVRQHRPMAVWGGRLQSFDKHNFSDEDLSDATRTRQSERRYPNSSIGFLPVAALASLSALMRIAQRKRSNSSRTARATSTLTALREPFTTRMGLFMEIKINTVQINVASEHLLLLGAIIWAVMPKIRRLLKKKK